MQIKVMLVGFLLSACSIACAPAPAPVPDGADLPTIVFVHGAWAGGWHFRKVEPLLRAAGYPVYRPTLTGLGERVHLAEPRINLSTHVEDIVKVIEFEDLDGVVLVGHSYGGMVISGVAERVPDRLTQLVYFDAIVPEDGESVMDLAGDRIPMMAELGGPGDEPWQLVPLWVKEGKPPPVDVPQPLATFTEPIRLGNPDARRIPTTFILTTEAGEQTDAFDPFAARARSRGWTVAEMEGGHNPHWFQPEAFVEVLLEVVAERRSSSGGSD